MKRHLGVLHDVLEESAKWLLPDPPPGRESWMRDWNTILKRYEHEGDQFLSITLPAMEATFLESLAAGRWVPNRLWKEHRKGGPVFLREFLGLVFDYRVVGIPLREQPSALAVKAVRQILLLLGKVKALPTPNRVDRAIEGFFETERELRLARRQILTSVDDDFRKISDILYREVFDKAQKALEEEPRFKHGPGQTAESCFGLPKYNLLSTTWTSRLDKVFDWSSSCFINYGDQFDVTEGSFDGAFLPPNHETPMRLTVVPKTAKSPRIIAMEPVSFQWVQQAILQAIDTQIQRSTVGLAQSISWRDQSRNRRLARAGSEDGSLATLDLSEASDRLHIGVVNAMLAPHPSLRRMVMACRSHTAEFDGRTIRLEKFAPMGSAMCFAFETMAFFAMCVLAVHRARDARLTRGSIISSCREISVYGDDIIVPNDTASEVSRTLGLFGLKVNARKSFWSGNFRESCGADYFQGVDVSVARLRKDVSDLRQPEAIHAWSVLQNQLFERGWFDTADNMVGYTDSARGSYTLGNLPVLHHPAGSGMYYLTTAKQHGKFRWNTDLYRLEVKTKVLRFLPTTAYDGRAALFHWFNSCGEEPSDQTVEHTAGRPRLVGTRTTFVAV